mgnify:FL=1
MEYANDYKAKVLVEAALTTDRDAARRHDVSRKSVYLWRKRLDTDMELQRAVADRWHEFREADTWAKDATHTIRKAQAFIRDATEALDPADPESLHAITEALSTLVDAKQMARIIDARLAHQNTGDRAQDRQDVAGYISDGRVGD